MPANGRWDVIRRLKVKDFVIIVIIIIVVVVVIP